MGRFGAVPDKINFAEEEEKTLKTWRELKVFEKSLELAKNRPRYTFFDGPPFATGLPHYGHILAGTIKDVVTRWAQQTGHYVERRFGWDTHGLPVEFEIDKNLGITGPADIYAMGIDKYNAECRKIVMRYASEWEECVGRLGRWIDFKNDYKTLYPWFMESVWWAFSELFKKGLVYRGVKVMPFSTACSTPLSNFEAGQNYKMVKDPAVSVAFRLLDSENQYLVAWTTTPWTLPSNLALCVHPDLEYVKVKDEKSGREYILLESRLFELKLPNLEIVDRFKGEVLAGKQYEPLFPYFEHMRKERGAFRVLVNKFVTTDQGTGVVHQAPYFGEIDYQVCLENGVVTKDMKAICPVDETGKFTAEVTDFAGVYVKDADKSIIKHLKEQGNLVHRGECEHSYPFCWRSDTPLLYKAVPSWFINVESVVPQLLENNKKTYWVPAIVKERRFANWLRDARDWAVSRNRFWGTPINIWISDDGEELVCIGSIKELEELSGQKITDIHRESVDHITIPSRRGKGVLHRVSEVFDCWFESGSMPYAQNHYPFERKKTFEENFPADFIAEGIDQTRGWFYTLLVLSTCLFGKPPFKNLICNGLVLAEDGNKMSKRKKNYPDPMEIVHKYGADALRLYLINSPVVRGENLRFREAGVCELLKDVFLPWFNAYRFLAQNVDFYEHESGCSFELLQSLSGGNVMDRWIESFTNSLVRFVTAEMNEYRLYAVVNPLTHYFDTLTNYYIRLNRRRIKGESGVEEQQVSLSVLFRVLSIIARLMAPFTPFFAEFIWQSLRKVTPDVEDSVHYVLVPKANDEVIDEGVERSVQAMRSIMELTRVVRDRRGVGVKYPLRELIVINRDQQFLNDVKELEFYILSELNVRSLQVSNEKEKYGIKLKAEPNFRILGARLKGDQKKVAEYLKKDVKQEELESFLAEGKLTVLGHELTSEEVAVSYGPASADKNDSHLAYHSDAQTIVVVDMTEDESLVDEGLAREITNRIQKMRKAAVLATTDTAKAYCSATSDSRLHKVLHQFKEVIEKTTNTPIELADVPSDVTPTVTLPKELAKVKDAGEIKIALVVAGKPGTLTARNADCVTVKLGSKSLTLLLETPSVKLSSYSDLIYEIRSGLGLWDGPLKLSLPCGKIVGFGYDLLSLKGQELIVTKN